MRASSGAKDAESESNESEASVTEHNGVSPRNITVVHMDAGAVGLQSRPLTSLLDEMEARLLCSGGARLKREMPYGAWRDLVSRAGPPAVLALALLPPEGSGGELRLPSGARRRLRDILRRHGADTLSAMKEEEEENSIQ